MKRLAILGSTGSIGTQCLDVVRQFPNRLKVEVLVANSNIKLLTEQALEFNPHYVIIGNEDKYDALKNLLSNTNIKVLSGESAIEDIVSHFSIDVVVASIVGYAGLKSTYNAIKHGKEIALANKETLVVAGDLITSLAKQNKVKLLPIDSEHSAIFQCLVGEPLDALEKIILTASGGPFRTFSSEQLQKVTKQQALKHPNWSMGAKITIDSATLMNKGLEIIEAKWLFDIEVDNIDVVVHPQSIIHSLVQFKDGSMKAQMGLPDMRIAIQYALTYPDRWENEFPRFSFSNLKNLIFEEPREKDFQCLALAKQVLRTKGNAACVLNAANEIAVNRFLKEEISFLKIPHIIEKTLEKVNFILNPSLKDYLETDKEARIIANSI